MKVVIDTNVLVSGLINVDGTPAQVINLLLNGRLILLYDGRILREYEEVLRRRKFGFGQSVLPLLDYIRNEGEFVAANPVARTFGDADDRMFYEVATTGNARFLVTGNKEHYPRERLIKSPKEFVDFYLAENEAHKPESV